MIRPGNERLTDRHRAAARWLPTTVIDNGKKQLCAFLFRNWKVSINIHLVGNNVFLDQLNQWP